MEVVLKINGFIVAAFALAAGSAHAAPPVYSQDFESGAASLAAWSGAGSLQSVGSFDSAGFGLSHLRNEGADASVLTLNGLGAHTSLTLTFDLLLWDSIDYNAGSFPYGDRFVLTLDGSSLIDERFGNYGTGGGSMGPGIVLAENGANRGYGGWVDSARRVSLTVAHTGSSAVFAFQYPNTQGAPDESFGLDNVNVSIAAVPEPETYAMLLAGLGLIGFAARRR